MLKKHCKKIKKIWAPDTLNYSDPPCTAEVQQVSPQNAWNSDKDILDLDAEVQILTVILN